MAKETKEKKPFSQRATESLYEFVSIFVSAVVIIMILFTFVCRFAGVVGTSMVPTLADGDWLVLSQWERYSPTYKDIVVISQPNVFNENIVKRVIATENQTIDINFETGEVYVDGVVLEEDYINNPTDTKGDMEFPITVPEGHVFVMGDNREGSTDSRFSTIGLINEKYILGRTVYVFSAEKGPYAVSENA